MHLLVLPAMSTNGDHAQRELVSLDARELVLLVELLNRVMDGGRDAGADEHNRPDHGQAARPAHPVR